MDVGLITPLALIKDKLRRNVGWVERSETQQSLLNVGLPFGKPPFGRLRCSNATCFKSGNPSNAVAPQPTQIIDF